MTKDTGLKFQIEMDNIEELKRLVDLAEEQATALKQTIRELEGFDVNFNVILSESCANKYEQTTIRKRYLDEKRDGAFRRYTYDKKENGNE